MRKNIFAVMNKGEMKRILAGAAAGAMIFCGVTGCSLSSKSTAVTCEEYQYESVSDYNGMSSVARYQTDTVNASYEDTAFDVDAAAGLENGEEISESSTYEQKLIKTYHYNFQTTDFQASMDFLEESLKKLGGYMESSEISGSAYPDATLVLRIPTSRVDEFLESVGSIGEITYQSVYTEDVSLNYYDISARLESLRAQHERLIELMEKAENLTDIAQLESQLSDVEYNINSYQSQLKLYDNLVDYTTVNISLSSVRQITPVEEDTFWTKIKKGLAANTIDLVILLENLVIALITGIPFILALAVVVLILRAIIRKAWRKRAERRAAKMALTPVKRNEEKTE